MLYRVLGAFVAFLAGVHRGVALVTVSGRKEGNDVDAFLPFAWFALGDTVLATLLGGE